MVVASTRLLRGSGYVAFDGEVPSQPQHSALASQYAHVTAPLRRLCDRYAGEVCVALCAGEDGARLGARDAARSCRDDARARASGQGRYERAVLDLVEAGVLADRVGEMFDGVVVDVDEDGLGGVVMIRDQDVEARVVSDSPLPLGTDVTVVLTVADVASRTVEFRLA